MNNGLKVILAILLTIILSPVLVIADSGMNLSKISQFYLPVIFAGTFSLSIVYPNMKKYLLLLSFSFIFLMVFFYFMKQIDISNWFGSLGFGSLMVIVSSYLPKLFTQGYIDKF